jgi:hypothetical protein
LVLQTSDSSVLYQRGWQTAVLDSAAHLLRVRGDTTIAGGSFSGVLVVDGSLTITGPWIATGLIVVRGSMRATADIEFVGALIVSAGETSVDLAGGSVRYAPCVVAREIRRAFPPRAVAGRAWAELF